MFKKLDSLLLKGFIAPFIATFFIAIFVLMMQTLWLYIDDIAGKGAGIMVIAEFLFYLSIALFPMALPIAILLASVMLMGNLAERYELAAMKSAGVSLARIMMPLIGIATVIAIFSFFCANNFIPIANLKFKSRLYDIRKQKPTLSMEEGVFNDDFQGFAIRVGQKSADNKTIHDVLIYDDAIANSGKYSMTTAKNGEMFTSANKRYFVMNLYEGQRSEEPSASGNAQRGKFPFVRTNFKKFQKVFDLSEFDMNRTDESLFKSHQSMMSTRQLSIAIDSINSQLNNRSKQLAQTLDSKILHTQKKITKEHTFTQGSISADSDALAKKSIIATSQKDSQAVPAHVIDKFLDLESKTISSTEINSQAKDTTQSLKRSNTQNRLDMLGRYNKQQANDNAGVVKYSPKIDTSRNHFTYGDVPKQQMDKPLSAYHNFFETFPVNERKKLAQQAIPSARYVVNELKAHQDINLNIMESRMKHIYEYHTKFSMAAVCIIFIFIGAPMGAIVRKGGFGYPLLVSVIFFMLFITLLIFCKKLAESYVLSAQLAAWVPCMVFFPIGFWLTYKAMNDSTLFNVDERITKIKTIFKSTFDKRKASAKA